METMNIYDMDVPSTGERFETLLAKDCVEIVAISSSSEPDDILYTQEEDEWVVLLRGGATLDIDGETKELVEGESIFIPSGTPHRVVHTNRGTLWIAVHIGKRESGEP